MRHLSIATTLFAAALLPVSGHAAGYKFTSFSYPGATGTVLTGVDNGNRIVGFANLPQGEQGFLITTAGSLATINPPGFVYAAPSAINAKGGVVGNGSDGNNVVMFEDNISGFGVIASGLVNQRLNGINSHLNMAGGYTTTAGLQAAYQIVNGVFTTLVDSSHCRDTTATGINDNNVVVGNCVPNFGGTMGFTYSKGKYTYIPVPAGATDIYPTSINNAGVIAGYYLDSTGGFTHGFVLSGTTFTTVDYPGVNTETQVFGINSTGRIVGSYYSAGASVAFSATPQ